MQKETRSRITEINSSLEMRYIESEQRKQERKGTNFIVRRLDHIKDTLWCQTANTQQMLQRTRQNNLSLDVYL